MRLIFHRHTQAIKLAFCKIYNTAWIVASIYNSSVLQRKCGDGDKKMGKTKDQETKDQETRE